MKNKSLKLLFVILFVAVISLSCNSTLLGSVIKFEPDALPSAQVGVPYETEIRVTQNNTPVINFSILKGALPAGLELVRVDGQDVAKISGTPEQAGTFSFTVEIRCYGTNVSGQTGEQEYVIVVGK